ncbi:spore coat protein U domain-containing protein [Erwinia sp. S43]|uniref:Csu type fimbrial protein n=1 Tax=unclassified Erwinia TaxID=2622719 RepID=UPI00190B4B7F|nr:MULTISPECIES: spore coat U domain-containing protein [unclassified Erwinia]MBK0032455.1 spore coat protein U domain-containing protein [Erwinia sp. S43]MCW1873622.1 spore coat U domain-containing protein [Erwinia sp. INIA01]
MKRVFLSLTFLLLMSGSWLAQAACTISPTSSTASFGTMTSFAVTTAQTTLNGTYTIDCGAGLVVLLGTDNITVRLTNASFTYSSTQGALGLGSDRIPLLLCTDSNCGSVVTLNGTGVAIPRSTLLDLAGLLNGFKFPIPLFVRMVPGAVVAAGNYTVVLTASFTYDICTSISIGNICLLANRQQGTFNVPITLNMTVTRDCTTITAPGINFGSAPLPASFQTVSQSLNVICTKGSTYTVGITNGGYAVGTQRYMASGSNRLAYQIYKGTTGTTYWGPNGTDRVDSSTASATSTDGLTKTFNYRALIISTQTPPPAGSYLDSVSVDVTF